MRTQGMFAALLLLNTIAAAAMVTGCASANESEPTPPLQTPASTAGGQSSAPTTDSAPSTSGKSTTAAASGAPKDTAAGALGTPQPAGPFQVTLSTEPAVPKVGSDVFKATVSKDGKPVTGASVTVSLSMPSMSMTGPTIALKPAGDHYEGSANLSMAADWEAKTTVKAAGVTGIATHDFKVP